MKVFSPIQARSAAEERTAKDALRAKNIAEVTQELIKTKEEVEKEFEETMARQRSITEEEFEEHIAKKKVLEEEVVALEERKRLALIQPLIQVDDVFSFKESLQAREAILAVKELQSEDSSRTLMRRLDEVSSREQDVKGEEQRIKIIKESAELQSKQVTESAHRHSLLVVEYQAQINEKEFGLASAHSKLDAATNLYEEKEKRLVERENEVYVALRLLEEKRELFAEDENRHKVFLQSEERRFKTLENSFILREGEVEKKEKESKMLRAQIEADRSRLGQDICSHENTLLAFKRQCEEKEKYFEQQKLELNATTSLQKEKENSFVKQKENIENERIQINDQRIILQKGFDELKRLKNK